MHLLRRFECASLLALAGLAFAGCAGPDAAPAGDGARPEPVGAARQERLVTGSFTSHFNSHDPFWVKRNGANGDALFLSWFDPNLVAFSSGSMKLKLDDTLLGAMDGPPGAATKPYTSAEYFSSDVFQYGTFQVVMKGTNRPGVISSFFLYTDSPQHDEIDVEFVGNTPLQFNYFQKGAGHHEHDYPYPAGFDPIADFNTYAIVWTPTSITWHVNGTPVHTANVALTNPMKVMMNIWAVDSGIWPEPGTFVYPGQATKATYDSFTYFRYIP